MIDTSLLVDAALQKSQALIDNLLSLGLMQEEASIKTELPEEEQAFDKFDAERFAVHALPSHECEQLTVEVPMQTLQVLTDVFEQVTAWQASSEHADLLSPAMPGSTCSTERSLCSSCRSSQSTLEPPSSPGSPTELYVGGALIRRRPESVAVVRAPVILGTPPRHLPIAAAPMSPRGSLRKTAALRRQPQSVGSARSIAWHPVAVPALHHALAVC